MVEGFSRMKPQRFTLRLTSSDAATHDGLRELNLDWKTYKSSACTFGVGLFMYLAEKREIDWLPERSRTRTVQSLIQTQQPRVALAWTFDALRDGPLHS